MTDPAVRYIIAGPARSGTTVTHLSLAGHPSVSALSDEVRVEPFFSAGISAFTHGNQKPEETEKGFIGLFDAIASLHRNEKTTALGFKTAISSYREALTFCESMRRHFPQVKVIMTRREDIVAQFGSLQRARLTGKWHSWVDQKKGFEGKIKIDAERLRSHAIDYLWIARELQTLKNTHDSFEVSFENDILPGRLDVYYQLFDFLGLPRAELNWLRSEKVAPDPADFIAEYAQHVEMIRDLRQRFSASPDSFSPASSANAASGLFKRLHGRLFGA